MEAIGRFVLSDKWPLREYKNQEAPVLTYQEKSASLLGFISEANIVWEDEAMRKGNFQ